MKNSVSDRSLYIESEEEDDDIHDDDDDDDDNKVHAAADDESDTSNDSSVGSPGRSRPSSYTTTWPQSYRQSINMLSSVTPPTIGFLGTPAQTISRLGSSFINSSFQRRHTPEIITSLIKPLLPTTTTTSEIQQRKSSHSLIPPLIPTKKTSFRKSKEDHKSPKAGSHNHELPGGAGQCSFVQAVANGVNVLCGVGILSAPYTVKQGGWFGLFILLLFALLAFYTGMLLRYCLDSEPGLETYPDIGQAAFGITGRFAVSIVLYLELYSICVEYIILEGDNLSSLFPNAQLNIGGIHVNSHVLFAVLTTIIVLPTTWLRDLSILSYISAGGVIACLLIVMCLFWVGLVDQVGFRNEGAAFNLPGIPLAIGLYGYCYSGHAVFPNIYSSLKQPDQFPLVLFTSFLICTVIFGGVAVVGFAMFGDSSLSQFTLNMPHEFVASRIAVWTTVVNPITKYSLTLMPMALSLEELIPENNLKSHYYSILIRTALTLSTLLVALSVPFFGLVMALIGSLLTMLVSFILPCICFLRIVRSKVTWIQVCLCIVIILVGVTSASIGSYTAISKIIHNLS